MKRFSAGAIGFFLLCAPLVYADTISFSCITNNSGACSSVAGQFTVDVEPVLANPNQVSFTFTNTGPLASSIADVYFDDGTLLAIATINSSAHVSFSSGASPGNLPGGSGIDPPFVTTAGFSADSNSPVQHNGVNPGEWLEILFTLQGGQTFDDTRAALALPGDVTGSLRIGIHVQGLPGGASEALVNDPPRVPEPYAAYEILLGALMALGCVWGRGVAARRANRSA